MRKILLFSTLFLCLQANAQFNSSAPWMQELIAKKYGANKGEILEADYDFTIGEMSEAFREYWKDKDHTVKGSGYKPFMRWENYWKHMAKADGHIPGTRELWASAQRKLNSPFSKNPAASWTALGPFNPGELAGALPGTGRVNAFAMDPNDNTVWYAGAPAGGLWKSTNSGDSWTYMLDGFMQIGVSSIAIDPNDSNTCLLYTSPSPRDA